MSLHKPPDAARRIESSLGVEESTDDARGVPVTRRIHALFGGMASVAVCSGSASPELFPQEMEAVDRAVPKRRLEFARGRSAARRALADLGWPAVPIPVGPDREPMWPRGVVGSITHCEGLVAAVVARDSCLATVGLDAEPAEGLPADVRPLVLRDSEWSTDPVTEKLVFSAKEAIYKALFPIVRVWIDFQDVEISLQDGAGTFTARSFHGDERVGEATQRLSGGFFLDSEVLVTGCYLTTRRVDRKDELFTGDVNS